MVSANFDLIKRVFLAKVGDGLCATKVEKAKDYLERIPASLITPEEKNEIGKILEVR